MSTRSMVSVDFIEPNTFNPNVMTPEEYNILKADMQRTGPDHDLAIDDILVSPKHVFYNNPEFAPRGLNQRFVIIDGYHRWRIAKEIGWTMVPVEIKNMSEDLAKSLNYRRNTERGHLDPILEAKLFKSDVDNGLTHKRVASKYNVERTHVSKRLKLLELDSKVVEYFKEPVETFKDMKIEEHLEEVKEYQKRIDELPEEEKNKMWVERNRPDELDEDTLVPRGTLTTSHLEAISTLPPEKQLEIAETILERDLTVRATESQVRSEKEDIAKEKRFQIALKKAKRKKCPTCGSDPDGFSYRDEDEFKCSSNNCWATWNYMKSAKEVEAEIAARMTEDEKELSTKRKEDNKKARANPDYIRSLLTPEEIHEKVTPWLLRKIHQLTEITDGKILITGKRGDEIINISYEPPGSGWSSSNMSLSFKVKKGDEKETVFGFKAEKKDYKKLDAKSRVDLSWGMGVSEESREKLRLFFSTTVQSDQDPHAIMMCASCGLFNLETQWCDYYKATIVNVPMCENVELVKS